MRLETKPVHFLDRALWPILRFLWQPLTKKQSYFWHWMRWECPIPEKMLLPIVADWTVRGRTGRWSNFWGPEFGWKETVTIVPRDSTSRFRIGFRGKWIDGSEVTMLCSIVCTDFVRVLIPGDDVEFFAVSYRQNLPIPIKALSPGERKDKSKIPLL